MLTMAKANPVIKAADLKKAGFSAIFASLFQMTCGQRWAKVHLFRTQAAGHQVLRGLGVVRCPIWKQVFFRLFKRPVPKLWHLIVHQLSSTAWTLNFSHGSAPFNIQYPFNHSGVHNPGSNQSSQGHSWSHVKTQRVSRPGWWHHHDWLLVVGPSSFVVGSLVVTAKDVHHQVINSPKKSWVDLFFGVPLVYPHVTI